MACLPLYRDECFGTNSLPEIRLSERRWGKVTGGLISPRIENEKATRPSSTGESCALEAHGLVDPRLLWNTLVLSPFRISPSAITLN